MDSLGRLGIQPLSFRYLVHTPAHVPHVPHVPRRARLALVFSGFRRGYILPTCAPAGYIVPICTAVAGPCFLGVFVRSGVHGVHGVRSRGCVYSIVIPRSKP